MHDLSKDKNKKISSNAGGDEKTNNIVVVMESNIGYVIEEDQEMDDRHEKVSIAANEEAEYKCSGKRKSEDGGQLWKNTLYK